MNNMKIHSTEISSTQEWTCDPEMVVITVTAAILKQAAQCISFLKRLGIAGKITLHAAFEYELFESASRSSAEGGVEKKRVTGANGDYLTFEPEYQLSFCNAVIYDTGYIDAVMPFKNSGDQLNVALGSLENLSKQLEIQLPAADIDADEDKLARFMLQRIENGELKLEDVPDRLARYGLMEPSAFIAEMHERMEMMQTEQSEKDTEELNCMLTQFPDIPFEIGDSMFNGVDGTWIGVEKNGMFITNPFTSACGRFTVEPMATYGIPQNVASHMVRVNENRM